MVKDNSTYSRINSATRPLSKTVKLYLDKHHSMRIVEVRLVLVFKKRS